MPMKACATSNAIPTPWKTGEIFHMSTAPAARRWPRHTSSVKRGIPSIKDNTRNCIIKFADERKKIKCNQL